MAISINWDTRVISVPKDFLTATTNPDVFELDTEDLRLELKALEGDETGIVYLDTHIHNTEVALSGITYARVIEIINGYTITFENGFYAINFLGSNNNYADVTNVNFVSIRPNNSAGLIVDPGIEESISYNGVVWFDSINGSSGSDYPVGTASDPVNNNDDLLAIVNRLNAIEVFLKSDMGLTFDINNFIIKGTRPDILFNPNGYSTNECQFRNVILTGSFNDSNIHIADCTIEDITDIYGQINNTWFNNSLSITDGENLNISNCQSSIPGSSSPVINMGSGSNTTLSLRKYSGGITIENCDTAGSIVTLELLTGKVHLEPSCTLGYISVRGGSGVLLDDRSNGTTIDITALNIGNNDTSSSLESIQSDITELSASLDIIGGDILYISSSVESDQTGSLISDSQIQEIWELHGLDITKPLTVTQSKRLFGSVDQNIATTGTGSAQVTTITRV